MMVPVLPMPALWGQQGGTTWGYDTSNQSLEVTDESVSSWFHFGVTKAIRSHFIFPPLNAMLSSLWFCRYPLSVSRLCVYSMWSNFPCVHSGKRQHGGSSETKGACLYWWQLGLRHGLRADGTRSLLSWWNVWDRCFAYILNRNYSAPMWSVQSTFFFSSWYLCMIKDKRQ